MLPIVIINGFYMGVLLFQVCCSLVRTVFYNFERSVFSAEEVRDDMYPCIFPLKAFATLFLSVLWTILHICMSRIS